MTSMRSCQKLPLWMDQLLAKAEPSSGGGSASGITQLRRWKKKNYCAGAIASRERSETMWQQQLCRHQGPWRRRGRRRSRSQSRDCPGAHDGDRDLYSGAEIHLQPMHTRAGGCPEESVTPWKAHTRDILLAGPLTVSDPCWSLFLRVWNKSGEGTVSGVACEELQPTGRAHGKVHGGFSPMGGTPSWSRGRALRTSQAIVMQGHIIWYRLSHHQDDHEILAQTGKKRKERNTEAVLEGEYLETKDLVSIQIMCFLVSHNWHSLRADWLIILFVLI